MQPQDSPNAREANLGPISWTIFPLNSNLMDISLCSHPDFSTVVAMKVGTWHDSCAVKISEQYNALQWSYTKTNFPSNLNYDGNIFVHEMGPWKIWVNVSHESIRTHNNLTTTKQSTTKSVPIPWDIQHVPIPVDWQTISAAQVCVPTASEKRLFSREFRGIFTNNFCEMHI